MRLTLVYLRNRCSTLKMSFEKRDETQNIIIIGAGLAGLSYAYGKLTKGNNTVIIYEKDDKPGGLMKTFNFDNFIFDFGPHIFRSNDENIMEFVKNILDGNYHHIFSNPAIFKYNKYFDNVIPCITQESIEYLADHVKLKIRKELNNLKGRIKFTNFKDCIVSQVGETLYWEFFGEFSRKWWGKDPKILSSYLAPKNLKITKEKSYGHVTTNYQPIAEEIYPIRYGIFEIIKKLKEKIEILGGRIELRSNIKGLKFNSKKITKIIIDKYDMENVIDSSKSTIISTIPLNLLCNMLRIDNNLEYRANICIFLKLKGGRMFNSSWIYFHDPDIIFGRIYEPLYYSNFNVPIGYTSLCVEVTCFENDNIWSDEYLYKKVVDHLINLNIIKSTQELEILGVEKYAYAYPIFTVSYKQELENIIKKLKQFKNLQVIGRTGSFSYLNMEGCIRWALQII